MRILALVTGNISNQLLFFPTLETLKQQYPDATIDVLVEPRSKQAYRICRNVDDVLVFDFQDRNSFADYLNLLGTIRDREYEILLTLKTSWRIKLLLWLNGIPTRIGYQDDSELYLTDTVERKSEQYWGEMYHDLVSPLGIKPICPSLSVNVPSEDIAWAEYEQQYLGIKNQSYIVLCDEPANENEVSAYPIKNWQEIIQDIEQKQPGLSILLLQTDHNQEWVTAMIGFNSQLKAVSPPDIGKTAAVIAGANLILCNSGTPMQLAIATGTYAFILSTETEQSLVPPNLETCQMIISPSNNLKDIGATTVNAKLWQS